MVAAGDAIFFEDLAAAGHLVKPGGVVGHVAETARTGDDVAVLHPFDVEHGVLGEQPADIAFIVIGGRQVLAGWGEKHDVVAEIIERSLDVEATADVRRAACLSEWSG